MKAFVVAIAVLGSVAAKADGFKCVDSTGQFGVKLYDNVQPSLGTRVPAVMVLSNGANDAGARTLATLTPAANNLSLNGADYSANLNFPVGYQTALSGVPMGQITQVIFHVDHAFNVPLAAGQKAKAKMIIVEKGFNEVYVDYTCERYLKN